MNYNIEKKLAKKYENILRKKPYSEVFSNLSEIYRRMGNLKKALDISLIGLGKNPKSAEGYVALGRVQFDLKDYKKAKASFTQALSINPSNMLAYEMRAMCHLKFKEDSLVFSDINQILSENPKHKRARNILKSINSSNNKKNTSSKTKQQSLVKKNTSDKDLDLKLQHDTNLLQEKRRLVNFESVWQTKIERQKKIDKKTSPPKEFPLESITELPQLNFIEGMELSLEEKQKIIRKVNVLEKFSQQIIEKIKSTAINRS